MKRYLFGLSGRQLDDLLSQYGQRYGRLKEDYARETLPAWRSGTTQMSGMVAARFYSLLPPLMPLKIKYEIAEELWRHVGPSSQIALRFGPDATEEELLEAVRGHIDRIVKNYRIPANMSQRFRWLSSGDIDVQQDMLNYLLDHDRDAVTRSARLNVPLMIDTYFGSDSEHVQSYTLSLIAGKHELVLIADHEHQGFNLEAVRSPNQAFVAATNDKWWLWVVGVAAVIFALWALSNL